MRVAVVTMTNPLSGKEETVQVMPAPEFEELTAADQAEIETAFKEVLQENLSLLAMSELLKIRIDICELSQPILSYPPRKE